MECDDAASYAEAASGRRRSDSCLSNTAGLFMDRHDRMSEEDREHIHPYNLLPDVCVLLISFFLLRMCLPPTFLMN